MCSALNHVGFWWELALAYYLFFQVCTCVADKMYAAQLCHMECYAIHKGYQSNFSVTYICPSLTLQGVNQDSLAILKSACLKDGVIHSDGKSHTCLEDYADLQGSSFQSQALSVSS